MAQKQERFATVRRKQC